LNLITQLRTNRVVAVEKLVRVKMIKNNQVIQRTVCLSVWAVLSVLALQLSGCSSPMPSRAPVEDRSFGNMGKLTTDAPVLAPIDSKPLPNLMNSQHAGKPGYYTVKPGDTVMQIGRSTNQNWRDIVKWNSLESANQIEVGQVLRIAPLESNGVAIKPPVVVVPSAAATATPLPPLPSVASVAAEDDIPWMWPSSGILISGYDEVKSKGLKIAGKLGDPVYASADGRVVYAGSGLRGYGNLVILKHNETYLTAYAHNQTLLVKEDQTVRKGQRIADMGSSDSERVMLHFEVRRNGKPVDPAKYLPGR
jgi:lipoprotein NlpD